MTDPDCRGPLSPAQVEEFEREGVLVLRGFYDRSEIEPIQRALHRIIGLVSERHGVRIPQLPFAAETFDTGFQELIAHDRKLGGVVYDAAKHIPAFVRLVASEKNEAVMRQLRRSDLVGVSRNGFGIRIDNPNEDRYRSNWHQDYPGNMRSIDGMVFWSPLVSIVPEIGPLDVCLGSHREGVFQYRTHDPSDPSRAGAYSLRLVDEEATVARYRRASLLLEPGDLALVDYLNLHASGVNRSGRSRWSMQLRHFNYLDPVGQSMAWRGGYTDGVDVHALHPEIFVD